MWKKTGQAKPDATYPQHVVELGFANHLCGLYEDTINSRSGRGEKGVEEPPGVGGEEVTQARGGLQEQVQSVKGPIR